MAEVQLRPPRRSPPRKPSPPTTTSPSRTRPTPAPRPPLQATTRPRQTPAATTKSPADFPAEIPLRFLAEIGTRADLRVYWGDQQCPNCSGSGTPGYHNARVPIAESDRLDDFELGGKPSDHAEGEWPTKCDHCDAVAPPMGTTAPCSCGCGELRPAVDHQVFHVRLYRAPNGELVDERSMVAGDCFYSTWMHDAKDGCHYWGDDCTSPHLHVVLPPDEHPWDTSSRASNCDMKDDRAHRCWVVHGDPSRGELVTVDKAGKTCHAGGGSIATTRYHGMLTNGVLRRC